MSPAEYSAHARIFLTGIAMGAADIVPGVSGGTIAFVTGIYQRLLTCITQFHPRLWGIWREHGIKRVWQTVDGTFISVLLLGIFTSILSLVQLMSYLLHQYPSALWAFFFGLIIASSYLVSRQINRWQWGNLVMLSLGCGVALVISLATPTQTSPQLWIVFLAGAIAICAMILPGISGSFILLLLGMYSFIIEAIKGFELLTLAVFALGCMSGLMLFSRLLNYLITHYKDYTLGLLIGFMLGSLNTLWPWKLTLSTRLTSKGDTVPFIQENVLPGVYQELTGQAAQELWLLSLVLGGAFLVFIIDIMVAKKR